MVFAGVDAAADGIEFQGKTGKTRRVDKSITTPAFKGDRYHKFQEINIFSMEGTSPEQQEKTAS
jgi:hypothetical protein